jgi:hypothetical protein
LGKEVEEKAAAGSCSSARKGGGVGGSAYRGVRINKDGRTLARTFAKFGCLAIITEPHSLPHRTPNLLAVDVYHAIIGWSSVSFRISLSWSICLHHDSSFIRSEVM